ncbi:MAG: class I SAM-dependent methyltransferase [Thermoplasmata archaeon]|nr:MAG: class I SAM-dependent methyltransferase [Thermoplasmata archaeon]
MKVAEDKRKISERKFWSKVAKNYDRWIESAFSDQYKIFKSKLASYVKSHDRILEVGCGTGDITFFLSSRCKEAIGVDISLEMIAEANRKKEEQGIRNVKFYEGDAYNLPFPSASFDKLFVVNALQTMKEPDSAIREGERVLRNNCEFLSITYCFGDSGFVENLKLIKWILIYGKPKYWHNFTIDNLTDYYKRIGFTIIEKEIIWKKPVVLFLRCRKEPRN